MTSKADRSDQAGLQPPGTDRPDVKKAVDRAIVAVRQELQKRGLWPLEERWPVKRKVFMMIYDRLLNLQASLPGPVTETDASDLRNERLHSRIIETVKLLDRSITENAAWDVADALKELLPEVAPPEYIYGALVEEKGRKPEWAHNWSEYFSAKELDGFIKKYEDKPRRFDTRTPSQRLVALYRIRNGEGRHNRAREGIRRQYLLGVSVVLGLSAVLLVLSWHWASNLTTQFPFHMLLVFVSGAVGAILSGTLRLRDLGRIVELQAAGKTLLAQIVLGATLATIVVLILQTGVVKIGDLAFDPGKPAEWFVVGFVSGFSEPFALGILKRLAALGDEGRTP
jgi:hypothetical protein